MNFISRVERPMLEYMAQKMIEHRTVSSINQVVDQYLDFVSVEPELYTLNKRDSYAAINGAGLGETEIRNAMTSMSIGLLSVLQNIGAIPVIRCAPGGPAEMLGRQLTDMLRDHIFARGGATSSLFKDSLAVERSRPLLLIFDRNEDLVTPLHHTATYQALVDDVLEHRLNRVQVKIDKKDGSAVQHKAYDLNTSTDSFYQRLAGQPFPEAVEANEKELADIRAKENAIRRSGATETKSDFADSTTSDLASAVESLPEILSRKSTLEAHTAILQGVMNHVAARDIPSYFELEQKAISTSRIEKREVLALLRDSSKGTLQDKLRLLAIVALLDSSSGSGAMQEYEGALREGCPSISEEEMSNALSVIRYLRQLRSLQRISTGSDMDTSGGAMFQQFMATAQSQATGLLQKAAAMFSRFMPVHITRVVDRLCEGRAGSEDDNLLYLDPRTRQADASAREAGIRYSEVIVFVIGGGCYAEYQNLQDYLQQRQKTATSTLRSIVYGCSELMNSEQLIRQLEGVARGQRA